MNVVSPESTARAGALSPAKAGVIMQIAVMEIKIRHSKAEDIILLIAKAPFTSELDMRTDRPQAASG
jgi:hypothetical protein